MKEYLIKAIQGGREDIFYKSWSWVKKRLEILDRDNKECQICKREGRVTVGTKKNPLIVHHIKHLKQYVLLALTDSNLITVCDSCHNKLHPEKLNNKKKDKFINEERW